MSNLREKAREIKAAGEETRGEFTPSGVPLRVYQYWAKRSKHAPERENFCHFWRVVAIWAPFMAIKRGGTKVIDHPATIITLLAAVMAGVIWSGITYVSVGQVMLVILLCAVGFVLFVAGALGGVALSLKGDAVRRRYDLPPLKPALTLSILGAPVAIVSFLASKAVQSYNKRLSQWNLQIGIGAIATFVIGFFTLLTITDGVITMLAVLGGVIGTILGVGLSIIAFSMLGDWIAAKRRAAKIRVEREWNEYYDEHGYFPGMGPTKPRTKTAGFFRGIGDFLVLLGQVVRVNKWKICPTVDIPKDSVVE